MASLLPGAVRQVARSSFTSTAGARALHTQTVASNAAAAPSAAATPSAAAQTATPSAAAATNTAGLRLLVWGGGATGFRAQNVNLFKRLFGGAAATGVQQSKSPLHRLTLRPTEIASPDNSGFRDVSFGHTHGALVTGKGDLYTYGSGSSHQLGHGKKESWVEMPTRVPGVGDVVQVACGKHHTLVLTSAGEVYSFGRGDSYLTTSALGSRDRTDALAPRRVAVPDGVRIAQISAGALHSLLLSTTGQVYAFGQGEYGRLGTGSSSAEKYPVLLQALMKHRIVHVVSGSSFNGALDQEGSVYTWGRHEKGQLGLGVGISPDQSAMESVPSRVEFPEENHGQMEEGKRVRVVRLAAGYKHMLALAEDKDSAGKTTRALYTWGNSVHTSPHRSVFRDAASFVAVGGGDHFSVAADANGCLASWGKGKSGCLGHNSQDNIKEPLWIRGFGASPEKAGVAAAAEKDPTAYFGRVEQIKAGHNHCAVLVRK